MDEDGVWEVRAGGGALSLWVSAFAGVTNSLVPHVKKAKSEKARKLNIKRIRKTFLYVH